MEKKTSKLIDKMIFSPEISIHQDTLLEKYNVSSQLSEIKVPTLILVGDDDFICPPSQAQRMHSKISNSDLHIFKNCGHFPFWESASEFLKVIHDWFQNLSQ